MPAPTSTAPPLPQEEAWLPNDPPPWVPRLGGWFVIGCFVAALLVAAWIRFPEVVRCRFRLIPEAGADPIQSAVSGQLHKVAAIEGQEVEEGTVLFEIRADELLTWQTELRAAEADARAMAERVTRTEEAHQALLRIKDAEMRQYEQERKFRIQHRDTTRKFVEGTRALKEERILSAVELLRAELDLASAEKDLQIVEQAVQKVALERAQMETERIRQRSEEQATQEKLKDQQSSLRRKLANAEDGVLRVRAPYRGIVISVSQRNPGSVVRPGQELAQLARLADRPLAELDLGQAGLDRVGAHQPVRLFFDAFPYERYGTLPGEIVWISASAVVAPKGIQFQARATLGRQEFDRGGRVVPVRVGMLGEARIRVGERTLLEAIFEPLRAWREQLR